MFRQFKKHEKTVQSGKMDDSYAVSNLQSLKGKAWSSLQHLMVDTSEDSDEGDLGNFSNGNHCSSPLTNGELSRSASAMLTTDSTSLSDTMKLKREDMQLFGQRPAWDPFYLVVCEHCDQVVKPQALRRHIEIRHNFKKFPSSSSTASSLAQIPVNNTRQSGRQLTTAHLSNVTASISPTFVNQSQSITTATCPLISTNEPNPNSNSASNSQPASTVSSSASNTGDSSLSNGVGFAAASESNLKTLLSTPTVSIYSPHNDSQTRFELEAIRSGSNKSTISSNRNGGSRSTPTSISPFTAVNSIDINSNDSVPKKIVARTKLLPCKDRKYDADRHCGVRLSEQDAPCTRSLTCKTHSLTLRRAVVGRSDLFDTLLNQHRLEKEAAMRAAGLEVKPTKQQLKQQQKMQKEMLTNAIKSNRSKPNTASNDSSPISMSPASSSISAPTTPARSQLLAQLQSPVPISSSSICSPSLVISPVKQPSRPLLLQSGSISNHANLPSSSSLTGTAQLPTSNVYGQPMHSSMATAIGIPILSKASDVNISMIHSNSGNKLMLAKFNGHKLTNRAAAVAAAAASAAQQQQSCASDLLFGCDASISRYDTTDHLTTRQQEQLLFVGCQPRPAAVCTFNARQLRIESPTGSNYSSSSGSILSSRLFDRKRDFTYSALAVFRTPSNVKSSSSGHSDEPMHHLHSHHSHHPSHHLHHSQQYHQSDSLQSNSNHISSDLGNSNSASLHSNSASATAATADKCFVNMFTNPVSATNLFSNM